MDTLRETLRKEVKAYAANGIGARSFLYPILDDVHQTYTVIAVGNPRGVYLKKPLVVVFARLDDNCVIIEVDNTDKPLVDALVQQGIPREQIVRAYAGETLPDNTPVAGD